MSATRIVLLAVLVCLCLPQNGFTLMSDPNKPGITVLDGRTEPPIQLERAPGTPGIIVLDGRTEPPTSIHSYRSEDKRGRLCSTMIMGRGLGMNLLLAANQTFFLQQSR